MFNHVHLFITAEENEHTTSYVKMILPVYQTVLKFSIIIDRTVAKMMLLENQGKLEDKDMKMYLSRKSHFPTYSLQVNITSIIFYHQSSKIVTFINIRLSKGCYLNVFSIYGITKRSKYFFRRIFRWPS